MKFVFAIVLAIMLCISCENKINDQNDVPDSLEEIPMQYIDDEPHGLWNGILDYQSEEEIREYFDAEVEENVISTWHLMRRVRGIE